MEKLVQKKKGTIKQLDDRFDNYRADWAYDQLTTVVRPRSAVLDAGAGDCRLASRLRDHLHCDVTCIDVDDFNQTDLNLHIFDGRKIPFEDQSFDYVLLLFVLHHSLYPNELIDEAKRVARREVVIFEDIIETWTDRVLSRGVHKLAHWTRGMALPTCDRARKDWRRLFHSRNFGLTGERLTGRQFLLRTVEFRGK